METVPTEKNSVKPANFTRRENDASKVVNVFVKVIFPEFMEAVSNEPSNCHFSIGARANDANVSLHTSPLTQKNGMSKALGLGSTLMIPSNSK
jgi:hypothetical protein